jgi:hypothetical protein
MLGLKKSIDKKEPPSWWLSQEKTRRDLRCETRAGKKGFAARYVSLRLCAVLGATGVVGGR